MCNAAERVYVQEGIAEEFTKKVIEKMKTLTYGPALAGTFDMGSMVNKAQQEHVDEMVQSAVAEGATVACGGHKAQVDGKGWFYEPTVITGCTHDMRIMRDEIFGPVLPITTFKTLDEAIEMANDSVYGLTNSSMSELTVSGLSQHELCPAPSIQCTTWPSRLSHARL